MNTRTEFKIALRKEKNVDVHNRILAVKMHIINNQSTRQIADTLEMAPSTISDCIARYREAGIPGLQTQPKSGRPRQVSKTKLRKIFRQCAGKVLTPEKMREIIHRKTRIIYSIGYIRKLLHKFGRSPKKPQKIHVAHSPIRVIKKWQKYVRRVIPYLKKKGFRIFQMDEAIFSGRIHSNKKGWTEVGKPWYVKYDGKRSRTVVTGFLSMNGQQMFRLYNTFNSETFLECVKQLVYKYKKIVIILDNAAPHKSKQIKDFLRENNENVKFIYLPVGSPEHNAVEGCWKAGKYDLSDRYFETTEEKNNVISEYFRTTRFKLSVWNHLFRGSLVYGNI